MQSFPSIDAFELWCWRRLLRVPWTARRSNQSILKAISPGCSLEGMMKLQLQYFGHLMRRADSLEKTLMLEKIEGRRREWKEDEMVGWHHWLNGHGFGWTLGGGDGREAWCATVHGVAKSWTWLSNWTELNRSPSHQEACTRLLFSSITEQELQSHSLQNENHNYSKLTKMITWITALSWRRGLHNSMKLWAMPCRATEGGGGHGREYWQNMIHWRIE